MAAFPLLSTGATSQLPYGENEQFYVIQEQLPSGKAVTHSANPGGATLKRFLVSCSSITQAEAAALEAFWITVGAQLGTFSFVDDAGVTHAKCRFDQPSLVIQYAEPNKYSVDVKIAVTP